MHEPAHVKQVLSPEDVCQLAVDGLEPLIAFELKTILWGHGAPQLVYVGNG